VNRTLIGRWHASCDRKTVARCAGGRHHADADRLVWTTDAVEGFLTSAGYPTVKSLPSKPNAPAAMVAAQA
jgi:hypothetical protein